jgi:hypothetical protein
MLGERAAAARGAISIQIQVAHKKYWGFLQPSTDLVQPEIPAHFEVTFWGDYFGKVCYKDGWTCTIARDQAVVDKAGEFILTSYGGNSEQYHHFIPVETNYYRY